MLPQSITVSSVEEIYSKHPLANSVCIDTVIFDGCSDHMLTDLGACVRECTANRFAVNGRCVPCDGPCPKGMSLC